MKKKELPIWFKIETLIFIFFSGAIGISFFRMNEGFDKQYLLLKLLFLISILVSIWCVSLIISIIKNK